VESSSSSVLPCNGGGVGSGLCCSNGDCCGSWMTSIMEEYSTFFSHGIVPVYNEATTVDIVVVDDDDGTHEAVLVVVLEKVPRVNDSPISRVGWDVVRLRVILGVCCCG
jgi:hypothetical protein